MSELVAKRYINAIKKDVDANSLEALTSIFSEIANCFDNKAFKDVINNPGVKAEDKTNILLDAVKSAKSDTVNNFIKLLAEHKRLNIIPSIALVLKKELAIANKSYVGTVYSNNEIDSKVINDLSKGLGEKYNSNITLNFVKNDFDGIKVDVEDLGIEIDFSNTRINNQIIEHIVKAI